jgi:hypothetical protein
MMTLTFTNGRRETASASAAQATALARKDVVVRFLVAVGALPASPTATQTMAGVAGMHIGMLSVAYSMTTGLKMSLTTVVVAMTILT